MAEYKEEVAPCQEELNRVVGFELRGIAFLPDRGETQVGE